jgi:hypothetical protein
LSEPKRLFYLLTPWSRVLLEKITVNFAASQEIPRVYGSRKFLTVPTSARHLFVSRGSITTWVILNMHFFYGEGLLALRPTPKLEGHPSSAVRGCLLNLFYSYPPYRRPFLHPQPEDAPCCGDRDPHSWQCINYHIESLKCSHSNLLSTFMCVRGDWYIPESHNLKFRMPDREFPNEAQ